MLLVLLTGATALVLEGNLFDGEPVRGTLNFILILIALMLTGGSANAFNMYFEREVDARMSRTRTRRPLPLGTISPPGALVFAISIGVAGVLIFAILFNLLSAGLALATILFYSLFYTLYLKPRTPYNIVIGGAAGSMAPVIAWAAASGRVDIIPIILFMIIFLWTPPHFWALALYLRKDYELVNYPMMPVARGDLSTRRQIFLYVVFLVIFSAACLFEGAGMVYAVVAMIAGALFMWKSFRIFKSKSNIQARGLFGFSIIYLFAIFTSLIVDALLR
jgi:protoheme IX farnesyltransferase